MESAVYVFRGIGFFRVFCYDNAGISSRAPVSGNKAVVGRDVYCGNCRHGVSGTSGIVPDLGDGVGDCCRFAGGIALIVVTVSIFSVVYGNAVGSAVCWQGRCRALFAGGFRIPLLGGLGISSVILYAGNPFSFIGAVGSLCFPSLYIELKGRIETEGASEIVFPENKLKLSASGYSYSRFPIKIINNE